MRKIHAVLGAMLLQGCTCESSFGTGGAQGPANNPAPAPAPLPNQGPAPAPAPLPGAPAPAPLPQTAPPPARPVSGPARVHRHLPSGTDVPVINGSSDFGSGNQTNESLVGLIYYLPVNTARLPDYGTMRPAGALYTTQLNIAPRDFSQGFPGIDNRFEWFGLRYDGPMRVSTPGPYTFRIISDDGAKMWVDGNLIIDNDGQHPPQEKRSGALNLAAGNHTVRIDYFQGPRYQIALQVFVTPPGAGEKVWTTTM